MASAINDPVAAAARLQDLVVRREQLRTELHTLEVELQEKNDEIHALLAVITSGTPVSVPKVRLPSLSQPPKIAVIPSDGWQHLEIGELPLSPSCSCRVLNVFDNIGIRTLGHLVQCTAMDLLRSKNFGRHSILDTQLALAKLGLKLAETSPGLDALKAEWNRTESAMEDRG